jgi:anti-sigma factor RsiW
MPEMNCIQCEERLSDYLENSLGPTERSRIELHLSSCPACNELVAGVREVIAWGRTFPVQDVVAVSHRRKYTHGRTKWLDALAGLGRWLIEPRTAMAIFTSTLVLSWLGSLLA